MPVSIASLHRLEVFTLNAFREIPGPLEDDDLKRASSLSEQEVRTALSWLLVKKLISEVSVREIQEVSVTDKGSCWAKEGLPELRIIQKLKDGEDLKVTDLKDLIPEEDTGSLIGGLKRSGCVDIVEGGALLLVNETPIPHLRKIQSLLQDLSKRGPTALSDLSEEDRTVVRDLGRKRGGKAPLKLQERRFPSYELTENGIEIAQALKGRDPEKMGLSRLTREMLEDGSWRDATFRSYDLSIRAPRLIPGRVHPYRSFLDRVKSKFTSLGFQQMRGGLVESEFWNMDALYMPQFHPARNVHDVYFVKDPTHAKEIREPYGNQVAAVHERGGDTGSRGWRYTFDVEQAKRLVLRSQGTALSARQLASGPDIPGKYFAIARCFRYDQVDATHLPDFYQIEGIVLGEGIHFRGLLGLLKLFAEEIADAKETKFLPAYFPFTEPSVEMHAKHPSLGWIELGGAGLFRPEVCKPLGVDVPVIAWGLGLDRMAMTALGIDDIRLLFSTDLEFLRKAKSSL